MELEQKWLREQNELVTIVKEREVRGNEIYELNDRLVVFTTKNMRTERNKLYLLYLFKMIIII